ncbi:MAG: hypothetical protein ABR540_15240 [Acidimicrobiales bacterium]
MSLVAFPLSTTEPVGRPFDQRLVRAAVSWSLEPTVAVDEAADRLLLLAAGNRTAVERALGRIESHRPPTSEGAAGPAAAVLRRCLVRGHWSW